MSSLVVFVTVVGFCASEQEPAGNQSQTESSPINCSIDVAFSLFCLMNEMTLSEVSLLFLVPDWSVAVFQFSRSV